MKGVLLAGGTGSRLYPLTHTLPKQLIPIANKPVLQYAIEDFREAGITEIGVILGNKGRDLIQGYLGDGSDFGVDITYIVQGEPLGLAHAVGCSKEFVGDDDFVVYLGDDMLEKGITDVVNRFQNSDCDSVIGLQSVEDATRFGIIDVDDKGNVTDIIEKPENPPTDLAAVGVYAYTPEIFDHIEKIEPSWRGELEISDAQKSFIESGGKIKAEVLDGWWLDVGTPEDVVEANRLELEDIEDHTEGGVENNGSVEGDVEIGSGTVIEKGARVEGPSSIGQDVVVGKDAYIGPHTTLSDGVRVHSGEISSSVVMRRAEISCSSKIVESLVGPDSRVVDSDKEGNCFVASQHSKLEIK